MRDRGIVARRRHHILGEVVGADREEGDLGEGFRRDRHGRHLDHDAERRHLVRHALARQIGRFLREQRGGTIIFVRHRDHREHHLQVAVRRGAQQRPDLHAEYLGARQRQPDAAQAEERVALLDREARHRLVAAGIDGADGDRLAARPLQHLAVGGVLRLLVGQARRLAEQELGAHQPDAVAGGNVDRIDVGRVGDIDLHADRRAGLGRRRLKQEIVGAGAAYAVVMRRRAE